MRGPDVSKWTPHLAAIVVIIGLAAVFPGHVFASSQTDTEVCLAIDESQDMLMPRDRDAAIALVTWQFEREGRRVVPAGCPTTYMLTHVRLGNTFVVTLWGTGGRARGTALGMNDLPALYSQMVRSLVTGRPMTGGRVVDRGNVTVSQSEPVRVGAESFYYARLGYGTVKSRGGATLGFGRRFELDTIGIDVSFFNVQMSSDGSTLGSLVKLQVLRFVDPVANSTAYVGAGLSYGKVTGERKHFAATTSGREQGGGISGELSVGYEFARASSLRLYVQADLTIPFYKATIQHTSPTAGVTSVERRYLPAAGISLGFGWGNRHR